MQMIPNIPGDVSDDIRSTAQRAARKVGDHLSDQANYLRDSASTAKYNTEDFVQNNPWQSLGFAAAVGFLLGVLVSRR